MHLKVSLFILVATFLYFKLELSRLAVMQVLFEHADDLMKLNSLVTTKDLLKLAVKDDESAIVRVL